MAAVPNGQRRLSCEGRSDDLVLIHGDGKRTLRAARVTAPAEELLIRVRPGGQRYGLTRGVTISSRCDGDMPAPDCANRQAVLARRRGSENRRNIGVGIRDHEREWVVRSAPA